MSSTPDPPLGLKPDVPLSAERRAALDRLAHFNLDRVKARLLKEQVLPPEWIDDAILEFRRYLGLALLNPGAALSMPSAAVDEVWHATVLFTRTYADLCEQALGRFMHHEPLDETTRGAHALPMSAFVTMYEAAYGTLPPIWRVRWEHDGAEDHPV